MQNNPYTLTYMGFFGTFAPEIEKCMSKENEISQTPRIVKSHDVRVDKDYAEWIAELKHRYRSAQVKASVRVNAEKLLFNLFYNQHDTKLLQSVIEMNGAKLLQPVIESDKEKLQQPVGEFPSSKLHQWWRNGESKTLTTC